MKALYFLLFVSTFISAQENLPKDTSGKVTYEEVIAIDGKTKTELYSNALEWVARYYKTPDNILLKDPENGKIIISDFFEIEFYLKNPRIHYMLTMEFKEGRYKYTITDFVYRESNSANFNIEQYPKSYAGKKKFYTKFEQGITGLINDLKGHVSNFKKSDW